MTNEEILEQQIEALEKLLQLRKAVIEELEAKVAKLEAERSYPNPAPWITTPWVGPIGGGTGILGGGSTITITNLCPDGSPHQYPAVWSGINPCCTKCGASMVPTIATSGYAQTNIAGQNQAIVDDLGNVHTLTNKG